MKYDFSNLLAAVDAMKREEVGADFPKEPMQEDSVKLQSQAEPAQPDKPVEVIEPAPPVPLCSKESPAQDTQPQNVLQDHEAGEPDRVREKYLAELRVHVQADLSGLSTMRLEYMRARFALSSGTNQKILAAAFDKEAARTGSASTAWTALFN